MKFFTPASQDAIVNGGKVFFLKNEKLLKVFVEKNAAGKMRDH